MITSTKTLSLLALASALALTACNKLTHRSSRSSSAAATTSGTAPIASEAVTATLRTLEQGPATRIAASATSIVIDNDFDYASLWIEHQQGQLLTARPPVDFRFERVLGVFGTPADRSVAITGISSTASGSLTVGYVVDLGTALTRPFHLVAVNDLTRSIDFVQTTLTGALEITPPADLVLGVSGVYGERRIAALGGTPPYRWDVIAGTMPAGVTLTQDGDDALLAGSPSQAGSYTLNLQVTDQAGATDSVRVTVTAALLNTVTVAGSVTTGLPFGDGLPASQAGFNRIVNLSVGPTGKVYVSDSDVSFDGQIRVLDFATGGATRTVAGVGQSGGANTVGALALTASLMPTHSVIGPNGYLYMADKRFVVRRVDPVTGQIDAVIGTGVDVFPPPVGVVNHRRDGFDASTAQLGISLQLAFDSAGNLLILDRLDNRIRKVDANTNVITTFAGGGPSSPTNGDGGLASVASLYRPTGMAVDAQGNVFVAHGVVGGGSSALVRRIDSATGVISTVAGRVGGAVGDGGLATATDIRAREIAIDRAGNVFIRSGGAVRRIDAATGIIMTLTSGSARNVDGLSSAVALGNGRGLVIHPSGALVIGTGYATNNDARIRVITPTPASPFN